MLDLNIDKTSDVPVYLQIVGWVHDCIQRGQLSPGDKLPTVRELAMTTGLSKGTVKHAYDELERLKTVEMTQGRGTFVLGKPDNELSGKKMRAMRAIDRLLDELEEMDFTPRDIEIYVGLKLRERQERYDKVRLAFVECNPEAVSTIIDQLYTIPNVEATGFLLDEIYHSPQRLDDTYDAIITSFNHYEDLIDFVSSLSDMVYKVKLNLTRQSIIQMAEIDPADKVGVWCQSRAYYRNMVMVACPLFDNISGKPELVTLEERSRLEEMLSRIQVLLVPPNYFSFTPTDCLAAIGRFQNGGGHIVVCDHRIEDGSFFYLEDVVRRLWEAKRI